MAKGFIPAFAGAFIAVVLVVIIIGILVFVFGPNFIPNTPCLLDSHCQPQKVCCTWRCDSTPMEKWTCPDTLCDMLGKSNEDPGLVCGCRNLKCEDVSSDVSTE
ncbi:MAG: hypothetical protein PHC66_04820 [Candidatus Nanoarchaeia archaeon]|nr:hypothetical protein [Candidatus Nanoarchaeia archaeon]